MELIVPKFALALTIVTILGTSAVVVSLPAMGAQVTANHCKYDVAPETGFADINQTSGISIGDKYAVAAAPLAAHEATRVAATENPDPKVQESYWAERARLLKEKLYASYRLLQEAFYPLVNRVADRLAAANDDEIRATLNRLKKEFPIHEQNYTTLTHGPYKIQYPELDLGPGREDLTAQIHYGFIKNVWECFARFMKEWNTDVFEQKEKFFWIEPDPTAAEISKIMNQFTNYVTPIGDYGPAFAKKLLRTTQIVSEIIMRDPKVREISKRSYVDAKSLLKIRAARTKNAFLESTNPEDGPFVATLEGVLSIHQTFANLLSKKIRGIETGEEALHLLVLESGKQDTGLMSEYTTRDVMGFVGPTGIGGHFFASPLEKNALGRLVLPQKTIDFLNKAAANQHEKSKCPMAGILSRFQSKTGIQQLAEAYLRIFEIVDRDGFSP